MSPRRAEALTLLLALALGLFPPEALAHAQLVRSEPAARSTISQAPTRIQLWFSERLEPAYATASVWDETGKQVDRGDARVDPDDPTRLAVSTPNLPPGRYTVRFRVLSIDGHVVQSSYTFTLRAPAR
jgi:copper resistance protein C